MYKVLVRRRGDQSGSRFPSLSGSHCSVSGNQNAFQGTTHFMDLQLCFLSRTLVRVRAKSTFRFHRCIHGAATCVGSWVTSTVLLLYLSRPRQVAGINNIWCSGHCVAATLDTLVLGCCSCPTACGFGTCLPARATPSSWLTGTACSPSCCTAVSSRSSREQHRARGPVKVRGHPAEQTATPSGPPCCPSAQRCVKSYHVFYFFALLHFVCGNDNVYYVD